MNPWDLSASDLLVWGIVLHLIADWPLQNDWMANNKMCRRKRRVVDYSDNSQNRFKLNFGPWWDRHPAAYAHASVHGLYLSLVFGWVAIPLAVAHLIIDCRWIVAKWSTLIGQIQPKNPIFTQGREVVVLMDPGMEVRFWTDQVFHIACIAMAALLVSL